STVSRLENGKIKPDSDTVDRYVDALGLPSAESDELRALAQAFLMEFDRWNSERPGELAGLQKIARRFEEQSREILAYTDDIIPGLLQTPQYIDHLFQALGEKNAAQRKRAIKARLERRKVLKRSGKSFISVINESAFQHPVIPSAVMRRQVEALLPWFDYGRIVQLYVLPFKTTLTQFPMNG